LSPTCPVARALVAPYAAPMTRVLLRIEPGFELPDYVRHVGYVPHNSLAFCDVDDEQLEQLRAHPGVLGLSLPRETHVVREAKSPAVRGS
jgi:hypothetical protein